MKDLKVTVNLSENEVSFSNEEFSNTIQEAGLSHTDLSDSEEITEYFHERFGDIYNLEVEILGFYFAKNFRANVEISELEKLGWEFEATYLDVAEALGIAEKEAKNYENENYHVEITVDENGKTFDRTVKTNQKINGIDEGSDKKLTGDDFQTIEDIKKLHAEGKLWNEENFIY